MAQLLRTLSYNLEESRKGGRGGPSDAPQAGEPRTVYLEYRKLL